MNDASTHYEIIAYVKDNPVMVLGTLGKDGTPHGAAVYSVATSSDQLYFVTKTETQKCKDIALNPNVSVTIVNAAENSTLQAVGQAEIVNNPQIIKLVMTKMNNTHARSIEWLPPIAKLRAGAYEIVGIKLRYARLARFGGEPIGSKNIFRDNT